MFYRENNTFLTSFQTGLQFLNLSFPNKIRWLLINFLLIFSSLDVWVDYQQKTNSFFPYSKNIWLHSISPEQTAGDWHLQKEKKKAPTKQAKRRNIVTHIITKHCYQIKIIIYAQLQCNSSFTSPAFHEVFLVGLIKFSRILLHI